jgi:uncharacterized membrane protein
MKFLKIKEFIFKHKLGLTIFGLAAVVFVISLKQSIWLDEGISIQISEGSISHIIDIARSIDLHPPLYNLFLHFSGIVFGEKIWIYRLWSGIFYALSAWVLYRYLVWKGVTLNKYLATLLFLTSPFAMYYGTDARSYMLVVLISLLQFVYFDKLCSTQNVKYFTWYILSSLVGIYLFYPIIFSLVAHFFYIVFFKRKLFKQFFYAWVAITVPYLPWIYLVIVRRIGEAPGHFLPIPWWQIPAVIFVGFSGGRTAITDVNHVHWYWPTVIVTLAYALQFLGLWFWYKSKDDREYLSRLFFVVLVPVAICLIISMFRFPVFDPRYYTQLFPLFVILLIFSSYYLSMKFTSFKRLLIGVLLGVNVLFFGLYAFNPWFEREPWKRVVPLVEQELRPRDVVVFIGWDQPPPTYSVYQTKQEKIISTYPDDLVDMTDFSAIQKHLDAELKGADRVWFSNFLEWQKDPGHKIRAMIEKNYRYVKTVGFFKVEFDLYEHK